MSMWRSGTSRIRFSPFDTNFEILRYIPGLMQCMCLFTVVRVFMVGDFKLEATIFRQRQRVFHRDLKLGNDFKLGRILQYLYSDIVTFNMYGHRSQVRQRRTQHARELLRAFEKHIIYVVEASCT